MEFTMVELAALILIALWGLVAMGKMRQKLSAISRTLQEIKVVLQDGRNRRVEGGVGAAVAETGDCPGDDGYQPFKAVVACREIFEQLTQTPIKDRNGRR